MSLYFALDANMDLYLNLKAQMPDGRQVYTFIRPGTQPGTLLHMLEDLRSMDGTDAHEYMPLTRLHVWSTEDESMSLNMFVYGLRETRPDDANFVELATPILEYAKRVQEGEFLNDPNGLHPSPSPRFEEEELLNYLGKCSHNYLTFGSGSPRRFLQHREIIHTVSGTEGTSVHVESEEDHPGHYWIDVAMANTRPRNALENVCRLLFIHKFDVSKARLDIVNDEENGNITMLRLLVSPVPGSEVGPGTFELLQSEIKRSKWLDQSTMDLVFNQHLALGVVRGEIITGICSLIHPVLAKENALVYSKSNILDRVSEKRFIPYASDIATLFLDRFNPKGNRLSDEDFHRRTDALKSQISTGVEDTVARTVLEKMLDVVRCTLKTNVYMPNRYALSFRLDPKVMVSPHEAEQELPYGIIFVHGRYVKYNQVV